MADIHKDKVIACNVSLLKSQMYSDIVICCGQERYKLHRAVICPRSTFFAAACKGDFLEAKTAMITMNDDDPQAVKRMIFYLYTLDYPDDDVPEIPLERATMDRSYSPDWAVTLWFGKPYDPQIMNNVLVYAVAEKYDIPELKELAKCKFRVLASSRWPHDDFCSVAEAVFTTTPDKDMGLRQIILDICVEHFRDILKDRDLRVGLLQIFEIEAAVLGTAIRKIDQDEVLLDEALASQTALRGEASKAKAEAQEAVDQKEKWMSEIESQIAKSSEFRCMYCDTRNFQWYLERQEGSRELRVQLQCFHCARKYPVTI